jgi:toxin HigB-1
MFPAQNSSFGILGRFRGTTTVVVAFASKRLRQICEESSEADLEYGVAVAEQLRHRLADIEAASSPLDLLAGSPRFYDDGTEQSISVSLSRGFKIVLTPNHPKLPRDSAGKVGWRRVGRVKVIGISQ